MGVVWSIGMCYVVVGNLKMQIFFPIAQQTNHTQMKIEKIALIAIAIAMYIIITRDKPISEKRSTLLGRSCGAMCGS